VRRVQQSRAGTGVRAFGDDFEGNLGQRRAYGPMITRWGAGGAGRCDAKLWSRGDYLCWDKLLVWFRLRGRVEIL
jgi:hypothetical protein